MDEQTEIKKENYLRRERRASSMSRSFTLENVDSDRITAKHENGVLTLILPKKEPAQEEEESIFLNINNIKKNNEMIRLPYARELF